MKGLLLTKAKNLVILSSCFVLFPLLFTACENPLMIEILEFKTVSFNSNGGSRVPDQSMIKGQKVKKPVDPVRADSLFSGWYLDDGSFTLEWDFDIVPTKNMTLYAGWRSFGIFLSPDKIDFNSQEVGYSSAQSVTVEVANAGGRPTGELTITLTGTDAASFTLSDESLASLAPDEIGGFSVSYAVGLPAGTYSAVLTVTNGGDISASADLSFTVTPALIYIAAVSITAPVTDAAPNTSAAGEGNFSIGEVTWSPDHNPFRPETRYTASVTLTANENYAFAENVSAEVNESPAAVTNNSGKTLSLSYEFEATLVKVVTGIVITAPPVRLNYTHGDALALTGLAVKIYYDDDSAQEVAVESFNSMGVSTTPANGEVLSHSRHDNAELTVSAGACSANAGTLTVDKKALSITGAAHTKTYDGGTSADGVTVTLGGIVSGDDVSATFTAAYPSADAGTTTLSITGVNLAGADAANYTVTQTGTFTVAGITRAAGAAITQPAVTGDTTNLSVTVSASLAGSTGQTVEYASNTTNSAPTSGWQSSGTFTLGVNTGYYVFARSASNNNYNAGAQGAVQAAFYTVTFDRNGGDVNANPASRTVFVNDVVTDPTAPTRAGYTFTGWYKEAACQNKWDFATEKVTSALTLYAGWSANSVDITLTIEQITAQDPVPSLDNITLSKSGAGSKPKTQEITVAGSSGSIQWKIAGVGAQSDVTESGPSFTIDANAVEYGTIGGHSLMLTVYVDSLPYMVNIRFTIEN